MASRLTPCCGNSRFRRIDGNVLTPQIFRQVRNLNFIARGENNDPLDDILKFADISRPSVVLKIL